MDASIYSDGTYLRNNPAWHADDSAWKSSHIAAMLQRHALQPANVCEIGCGSGEILVELASRMAPGTRFTGYDISPDAYQLCSRKAGGNLQFRLADLFETGDTFDLALAIDVFEHVEDCHSFLRNLRGTARHKMFHIPLDLSALSLARDGKLLAMRKSAGHIHYFSKDTALALLGDTGYTILDYFYTSGANDFENVGWKTRLARGPRRALFGFDEDFAVRLLGGYSLLVLAQ